MIRIAVCDDEPCFTQQISHVIANHARDISPSPETVLYTSSGQLLYDVEEGAHFDLLLLDIEMPEKDGMSLAASLRRHLPLSLIIFITSHTQYAVKAYELSVFRYIPKSEMETCLPLALKDASRILKQSSSDTYIIESARRIQKLSAEDIIYVYKQQKYSVIAAKAPGPGAGGAEHLNSRRHRQFSHGRAWIYREPVPCGKTGGRADLPGQWLCPSGQPEPP